MAKETVNLKLRTLVKAYLVFNKGKKCTAKEISEWINSHWFGLNRTLVNANKISRLINSSRFTSSNMMSEIIMRRVVILVITGWNREDHTSYGLPRLPIL